MRELQRLQRDQTEHSDSFSVHCASLSRRAMLAAMSDNNDDTEAQDTPRNPTLPPPPHTAEPSADVALDGPPMAPRVQVLSPVEHVRFGGAAGVRVQQLGAATVNRVQPGADVFDAFVRVRRDTLVQVRSALDASDSLDELRETVGELLASTFELLR